MTFNARTSFLSENFLVRHDDASLRLITFAQFQEPNCRDWKEIELNNFNPQTRQWQTDEFSLRKFDNLNGCALLVNSVVVGAEVAHQFDHNQRRVKPCGKGIDLNDIISESLNFKSLYNLAFINQFTLKPMWDDASIKADFKISVHLTRRITALGIQGVVTQPFTMDREIILIPPDELYTQFEKLFLPFEEEVWFWLIVTMTTAVITIIVVGYAPAKVRKFVFGSNVNTPMLNLM